MALAKRTGRITIISGRTRPPLRTGVSSAAISNPRMSVGTRALVNDKHVAALQPKRPPKAFTTSHRVAPRVMVAAGVTELARRLRHAKQFASVTPTALHPRSIGAPVKLQLPSIVSETHHSNALPLPSTELEVLPTPPGIILPTAAPRDIGRRPHLHGAVRPRAPVGTAAIKGDSTIGPATPTS